MFYICKHQMSYAVANWTWILRSRLLPNRTLNWKKNDLLVDFYWRIMTKTLKLYEILLFCFDSVCEMLSRVIKVSMLTHTYPQKTWVRFKCPSGITKLTAHFTWDLMSYLMICKCRKEHWHMCNTECPYWDQVSLNYTNSNLTTLLSSHKILMNIFFMFSGEYWRPQAVLGNVHILSNSASKYSISLFINCMVWRVCNR